MYSVVIADDEKKIRTVLKNLIHWESLSLELYKECLNGDELLNLLRSMSIDIVITDMQMPGICGVELLQKLREICPYLPVLVVSGYDDFKYAKQAIVSQAIDYILKPVEEEELNDALAKAVKKARDNRIQIMNSDNSDSPIAPILVKYFNDIYEAGKSISGTEKQNLAFKVKQYLDKNFNDQVTLSDLSNQFYSNKEYISKVYRSVYGVTVFDYIDHVKIVRANNMLAKGFSMKEITYELGYYDESHFHRKYKKIMGIAPSEYEL